MGRDRNVHQPLISWLLGALLAFCAVLPVASGQVGSPAAASGAATLVRSSSQQHLEATTPPQRPDGGRSTLHLSAGTPPARSDSPAVSSSAPVAIATQIVHSTSLTSSVARAPPSVRA
jgi:hypothetical protein